MATMFTHGDNWVERLKPMTIFSCIFLIVVVICGMSSDAVTTDYTYVFPDVLFLMELSIINIQIHMCLFWNWKDHTAPDVDKKLWKNLIKVFFTPVFTLLIHTFLWIPCATTFNLYMLSLVCKPEEGIPDDLEREIAVMNFWLILLLPFMIKKIYNYFKGLIEDLHYFFFET